MGAIVLIVVGVLVVWFIGKMSKPASALTALAGVCIAWFGATAGNAMVSLFGVGLLAFSAVVFLLFNGGRP